MKLDEDHLNTIVLSVNDLLGKVGLTLTPSDLICLNDTLTGFFPKLGFELCEHVEFKDLQGDQFIAWMEFAREEQTRNGLNSDKISSEATATQAGDLFSRFAGVMPVLEPMPVLDTEKCHICQLDAIDGDSWTLDSGEVSQTCYCHACSAEWKSVFKSQYIENAKFGDLLPIRYFSHWDEGVIETSGVIYLEDANIDFVSAIETDFDHHLFDRISFPLLGNQVTFNLVDECIPNVISKAFVELFKTSSVIDVNERLPTFLSTDGITCIAP